MQLECTSCESVTAKRDRKWFPERGYDPLLRKYTCDGCGKVVYLARGRKWILRKPEEIGEKLADKPVRPKKKPPTKPIPAEAPIPEPEKVPAGVGA